jgi:D-amino-acid dehydrogenase
MTGPTRVLIVGGGVVGASSAYFLSKAGCQVTVVESGAFGKGCSHGNCGYVSPSHILPLAVPGAIGPAVKSLLNPDSPFRIKPRFDPALWNWLYRFARRCNTHDMMESARAINALLDSSRRLYAEIIETERLDCEWETKGIVFVLQTAAGMAHYEKMDRVLQENFGMGAARYDGDALVALEPALKPGLAGGWHYQRDAHLRPDRLMAEWHRLLIERGVTILENCKVHGLAREAGRARAALTTKGAVDTDAVVVAAGAWTPFLRDELGGNIPIQPGKGYSITMTRPTHGPKLPLIFEQHRVAVTPMQSGFRIGSTMEFAGYDATLNRRRLEILRRGAALYLREPFGDVVEEEWFGWRPMTYDSRPIIGFSPALANVLIAAGHNMLGLSMAPATGKLVAELLTRQTPHVDPKPYAVDRFAS